MRYLNADDPFEAAAMAAVARRALEVRDELADEDATRIANAVWSGF